jgi:hypothetical protein
MGLPKFGITCLCSEIGTKRLCGGAYGVVSGSNGDTVVAPIDWMDVKLW